MPGYLLQRASHTLLHYRTSLTRDNTDHSPSFIGLGRDVLSPEHAHVMYLRQVT